MTRKRAVLTAQARREVRQVTASYREEGGAALARRWVASMEAGLTQAAAHPQSGASRYAELLRLHGLRSWPLKDFPFLIFYLERDTHIDVWRVLHAQRDIPGWMGVVE